MIARGSSTPYKKTNKTPKQIADELDARYLLTATVRWQKGGGPNRVQVNPELVEIKADGPPASRWQQPFDAALTDVFQVQSDIATKVAQALGTTLGAGDEKRLSDKPTGSLAAYDAFLKGEAVHGRAAANDPASLRKALAFYEEAVALDPGFAQAWAQISQSSSILYFNSTPTPRLAERAREAAQKALALAPERPDGYYALGTYERVIILDMRAAREQLEKALRIAPRDADVLGGVSQIEASMGLWEPSLERLKRPHRLDPRAHVTWRLGLGNSLYLHPARRGRRALYGDGFSRRRVST